MINLLLDFLKTELNQKLQDADTTLETVGFPDLSTDPPTFQAPAINFFLGNLEEELILSKPNRYLQRGDDGEARHAFPPLRLNLFLLFAAKYSDYITAMKKISQVLAFFQANPVFTKQSHPGLPEELDKLTFELNPLSYSQLNEIWGALKTTALPSVCYKVRMIIFEAPALQTDTAVGETTMSMQAT